MANIKSLGLWAAVGNFFNSGLGSSIGNAVLDIGKVFATTAITKEIMPDRYTPQGSNVVSSGGTPKYTQVPNSMQGQGQTGSVDQSNLTTIVVVASIAVVAVVLLANKRK